jgi:Sec-independent protein translocase protein TatA
VSLGPAEILVLLLVVVVLVFVGAGRSPEVAGCRTGA